MIKASGFILYRMRERIYLMLSVQKEHGNSFQLPAVLQRSILG